MENALPRGYETILLADDEDMVRKVGVKMLQHLGYEVLEARNGHETLRFFEENKGAAVNLALIDISMPGLDGLECLKRLKDLSPNLPVVITTGYNIDNQRESLLKQGVCALIQKPFTYRELAVCLRLALDKKS